MPKSLLLAGLLVFLGSKVERNDSPDIYLWNEYSNQKVDFYRVDADHMSMIEDEEDVKKLAMLLKDALDKTP